jgi:hypothetical protein
MILEHKKDGRRKGRLVGQGFWEDVCTTGQYVDSPVACFATVRSLLFMNGREGEVVGSGDMCKAFLKADEYPDDAPPRYVYFRMFKGGPIKVWRLKGPLYGSRDSPRLWFESIRRFLLNVELLGDQGFKVEMSQHKDSKGPTEVVEGIVNGFKQGDNEPCVFVHPVTGLTVALFVDDVITRGMPDDTAEFFNTLHETYPLREWGILSPENPLIHLGYRITEEIVDDKVYRYLDQSDDVARFIIDNELCLNERVGCPMPDKDHISKDQTVLDEEDQKWFKSLVGQMSWFAISLRYDIAHSVSRLQQFSKTPTKGALDAAIRVATYLATTADFRIGGEIGTGVNQIEYYTDSDFVGDRKLGTRSHSAFIALLNGIPVHWRSRKQPKTVLSPAHAEIYALSEGVKEAKYLQWILADMGIELPWPIEVNVDNTQAISFCNQTCLDSKLKGMIDNRDQWVKELKDDGVLRVEYVNTRLNKSDILSKCLSGTQFREQVVLISKGCQKGSQVKRQDIFVNLCEVKAIRRRT